MLRNLSRRVGRALRVTVLIGVATAVVAVSARVVVAQPGHDADTLEPGVLAPQDEATYGVGLERGLLGPDDELESGLIGLDDPIFQPPPPQVPRNLRPPGWVDPRECLESGLIGLDDPIFWDDY